MSQQKPKKFKSYITIAATADGIVCRYRKAKKCWVPIDPRTTRRVWVENTSYEYSHIVAELWVPPYHGKQVRFIDGDKTNTHPSNMYWLQSTTQRKTRHTPTRTDHMLEVGRRLAESGKYKQLSLDPRYWVREDGSFWYMRKDGEMTSVKGSANGGHMHLRLGGVNHRMTDIALSLWGSPRPTPMHTAEHILTTYPPNNHPSNLQWVHNSRTRIPRPDYTALHDTPTDPTIATKVHEQKQTFFNALESLQQQGAVRAKNDWRIWVTPDCRVLRVSEDGGLFRINPDATGRVKLPTINPTHLVYCPDLIADALTVICAGTADGEFPRRPVDAMATLIDPTQPPHPSNLMFKSTGRIRTQYEFVK